MTDRVLTRCDHCDQVDNHPKVHFGLDIVDHNHDIIQRAPIWHHDCVPQSKQAEIIGGVHSQHPLLVAKVLRQAAEGTRGDDLLNFIQSQQMQDFGDATAMAKATTYANDILDATYQSGASGTFVLGATTYTLPLKCLFLSTLSTAASQGTEWSTSGGYTAGGVSLSGLFTVAASSASKSSSGAVTVSNAPAQTWADNEIKDSTGTPKRMVFKGTPSLGKTVNSGDTCTIPSGSLTGTES